MLQESDYVVWCGTVGEVTTVHAGTVYVDFYLQNKGWVIMRYCQEFDQDGKNKSDNGGPVLENANSAQIHFFNLQEAKFMQSSEEFRYNTAN